MARIVNKINPKKILQNPLFEDAELSLENRGMLLTLIALSGADGYLSIADLPSLTGLSEWTIRTALNSLTKTGYLNRVQIKEDGRFDWEFQIQQKQSRSNRKRQVRKHT